MKAKFRTQYNFLLLFLLITINSSHLYAQHHKSEEALDAFLDTEFIEEFQEMREKAEETVRDFKQKESKYEDTYRVEEAYNATVIEFNKVLMSIKNDLLDRKKRKYIADFPDAYAKSLEADMYRLNDFYDANFRQVLLDVTDGDIDGSPLLLAQTLVDITIGFVRLIGNWKRKGKKFTEQYLMDRLVAPNQFKTWSAISKGNDEDDDYGYNSYDDNDNYSRYDNDEEEDNNYNSYDDDDNDSNSYDEDNNTSNDSWNNDDDDDNKDNSRYDNVKTKEKKQNKQDNNSKSKKNNSDFEEDNGWGSKRIKRNTNANSSSVKDNNGWKVKKTKPKKKQNNKEIDW